MMADGNADRGDGDPPLVLIAGGGVAGLEAMLALRELAGDRVAIELLAAEPDFLCRPLEVIEPFFEAGELLRFEVGRIAADCGATLRLDTLLGVDAARRMVTTESGGELGYDMLLIACGAVMHDPLPGALTFRGSPSRDSFVELLAELVDGRVKRVVFAAPAGVSWTLPLYELALLVAAYLSTKGIDDAELAVVSPEDAPLELFGARASQEAQAQLEASGIAVHMNKYPAAVEDAVLRLVPDEHIGADRVIVLPRLEGPDLAGVPHDEHGFIPTDDHCRVEGLTAVYAAGDATTFPVKQGGVAAHQADVAAEMIAAEAGAPVTAEAFHPVLRGLLLTGEKTDYLSAEIMGGRGDVSEAADHPLWSPPEMIAGRYLGPYFARIRP